LSVLFQITVSDYFFGVFNLFFNLGALEKYAFVKQLRISLFIFLEESRFSFGIDMQLAGFDC
jgi:hypothetical protein